MQVKEENDEAPDAKPSQALSDSKSVETKADSKPAETKKAGCKWCEKGECWSHGQIEKPKGKTGENGTDSEKPAGDQKPKGDKDDPTCWDFVKTGECWRGDACPFIHPLPGAEPGDDGKPVDVRAKAVGALLAEAASQFDVFLSKAEPNPNGGGELDPMTTTSKQYLVLESHTITAKALNQLRKTAVDSALKCEYNKPWVNKQWYEEAAHWVQKKKQRTDQGAKSTTGKEGATSTTPPPGPADQDQQPASSRHMPQKPNAAADQKVNPPPKDVPEDKLKSKLLERKRKFEGW